jgi:hypothetical protein
MQLDITNLDAIVFSGGGIRGLSYVGALMAFEDTYHVKPSEHFKKFAGTSVGSVFALACAIDADIQSAIQTFYTVGLETIFDKNPAWLLTNFALNDGQALKDVVGKMLESKGFSASTTMLELYQKTGRHLIITVIELLTSNTLYLDHTNEGSDMPVLKAMMGSMALPPLFPPVTHISSGTQLLMMDGGLLDNFPIALFKPENTLGLRTTWYIEPGNPMTDINAYYTRILSILQLTMHSMQTSVSTRYANIIYIDLGPITADSSNVDSKEIIFKGYRSAISKFSNLSPNLFVERPTKFLSAKEVRLPAYIKYLSDH